MSTARFGDNDMGLLDSSFRSEVVGGDGGGVGSGASHHPANLNCRWVTYLIFSSSPSL